MLNITDLDIVSHFVLHIFLQWKTCRKVHGELYNFIEFWRFALLWAIDTYLAKNLWLKLFLTIFENLSKLALSRSVCDMVRTRLDSSQGRIEKKWMSPMRVLRCEMNHSWPRTWQRIFKVSRQRWFINELWGCTAHFCSVANFKIPIVLLGSESK